MMRIRRAPRARADLAEISWHIAQANSTAAFQFLEAIDDKLRLLARHPEMGQLRPELAAEIRSFVVGSYVLYYRAAIGGIELARVIHAARDIDALFYGAVRAWVMGSIMETPAPKFAFYEKVKINSSDPAGHEVQGELGAVLGRSQSDDGEWHYGVLVYSQDICWSFAEHELLATGEHAKREDFYDGSSVRVSVDKSGRGSIVPGSFRGRNPQKP